MPASLPTRPRALGPVPPDVPGVPDGPDGRAWRAAAERCAFVGAFGALLVTLFDMTGIGVRSAGSAFPYNFARLELLPSLLLAAFGAAAAAWPRRLDGLALPQRVAGLWAHSLRRRHAAVVACAVVALAVAAAYGVVHTALVSADEFNPSFQARIFAHGAIRVRLHDAWAPFADAITPTYVGYREYDQTWASRYLPGYAVLKTPFEVAGLGPLLNPLLAGASVVFLALAARRLWPRDAAAPAWLAMLLLATSPQFLITAATGFSMPAHLALNLLWFWLYLRGTRGAWLALGPVGALALGLHSPFPHALFVTPFLLRTLRDRRWRRLAYLAGVYGVASAGWLAWMRAHASVAEGGGSMAVPFVVPGVFQLVTLAESVVVAATWQSPVLTLGVALALATLRQQPRPVRDLAGGVALTFAFHVFLIFDQSHGWGYRYAHGVLGNGAVLGAAGLAVAAREIGARAASGWAAASLVITAVVQLPLRAAQVERESRPFAAAVRYIAALPADVVLLPIGSLWYDRDLIRNDPLLARKPVVVALPLLSPQELAVLRARYAGRVREVRVEELRALGWEPPPERRAGPPR